MKEYFDRVYTKSREEYYKNIKKYMDKNIKKFIITANPETFMLAQKDSELNEILLNKENDVLPDGIAIVKAGKFYGVNIEERITGIDTVSKILELANEKKKSLFLFGAKDEVLNKLVKNIEINYSSIKLLGVENGYVKDKDKVMKKIVELKPDVCLLALGIPLQEKLIAKYINKVNKGIYIGVGGTFDVLSGTKKRAPKIFIKLNMEWLYRIIKEPKRIKRFWKNNVMFVFRAFRNKTK